MKTIAIIGGGITGVSTAYYLDKWIQANESDVRIVLIEADDSLGGKIATVHDTDFVMETGADSIVTRKENVAPLIEELGLQDEVVYNATGKSYLFIDQELKLIPEDTVFGIPLSIESLAKSHLISAEGKVEALKDFYTTNETFSKNDSIGLFLESFLGNELVERQIAPVLSGVYSGKLNELTIASTLPYLLDYKNEYGSILKGLSENKSKFKGTGKSKFLSFQQGMSTLLSRMEERLTHADIRKGVAAERIEPYHDRYRIALADGNEVEADFVVISTLHPVAQRLLHTECLDEDFNQLKNSSLISVYVGFDIPDEQLPEDGTGFIVAESSDLRCDACTWTSRKWDHTSKERTILVRMFYKSSNPVYATLQNLPEEELLHVALSDIKLSLGITNQPVTYKVTKWQDTMPNYHIKHHEIVQSLVEKLRRTHPNVLLAGCSYYGVGIPDCIANGEKTAQWIAERLQR